MPSWKKVITSGSSAHLSHVTASANISGSSTSTGSFGAGYIDNKLGIGTTSPSEALHVVGTSKLDTIKIGDSYLLDISNNYLKLRIANGDYFAIHGGSSDTEYLRLTNSGNVGIGTTSPDRLLHVHKASAGTVTAVSYTELVIEDDGGSGMSILAPDANSGNIVFGFPSDNDSVQLRAYYNSGNPRLAVELAASEKFNFIGNQFSGSAVTTGSFGAVTIGQAAVASHRKLTVAGGIEITQEGGDNFELVYNNGNNNFNFGNVGTGNLSNIFFYANNAAKMFISGSGNVGIGTVSPSQIFHVVDSSNGTTPDLLSVRSTGSEVRIGIGVSNPSTALDFSTALPNGGGTIQGVFRMNLINNIRVGSHNGRLVLQSNNGIRIGAYNDNPSGNSYGLEVKHTRASTNTGDNILNVLNSDNTSLMMVKSSGNVGIGETSPDELLHIKSSTASKPVIKIENAGDVTNGAQLHFVMSTTGEGVNDIPGTIRFKGMNSANAETEFSTIYTRNIDITDGTEDSEMHFRTMAAGTLDSTLLLKSSDAIFRGNISGSSTSTGSFGKVEAHERVSIFSGIKSIQNEAALSIYADNRKSIHIDHDSALDTAVYIDNTNAISRALQVYSNVASGQNSPLIDFTADNTSFDENVLYIKNDGTADTVNIVNTGAGKGIVYTGGSYAISGSATSTGSFGELIVAGNITAKQYIVSASTTYMTTSFSDGNTKFGDSSGDVHQFTGSFKVQGSILTNDSVTIGSEEIESNFSSSIAGRVNTIDAAGSGVTISNNSNNRILTGDGSNANAESALTFDGAVLGVTSSANSPSPTMQMVNTNTSQLSGSRIEFYRNKTHNSGDEIGAIDFFHKNTNIEKIRYASLNASQYGTVNGSEGAFFSIRAKTISVANDTIGLMQFTGSGYGTLRLGDHRTLITGSSNSTASFGKIVGDTFHGDGSDLTNITATTATTATNITATANNSENAALYLTFVDGASGAQGIETDSALRYNPSTDTITATNLSGNASTATTATNVTATENNSLNESNYIAFVDGASGAQGIETDSTLRFNPSTNTLSATNFSGTVSTATTATTVAVTSNTTTDGNNYIAFVGATAGGNGVEYDSTLRYNPHSNALTASILSATEDIVVGDDLYVGGGLIDLKNTGTRSQIRLYCESSNAHWVGLQAPAHADFSGNVMLNLPATATTLVGTNTTDTLSNKTIGQHLLPDGDNTRDLGSGLARWRNLYTGDLHLSNEGSKGNDVDKTTGDWTIQEGEDDLYLFNNKSGKKYKFKLEEL